MSSSSGSLQAVPILSPRCLCLCGGGARLVLSKTSRKPGGKNLHKMRAMVHTPDEVRAKYLELERSHVVFRVVLVVLGLLVSSYIFYSTLCKFRPMTASVLGLPC